MKTAVALTFRPLTPSRWKDLETLFGPNGACAGCWCMWWRLPRSKYRLQQGAKNKAAFKKLVAAGRTPGILAYEGRTPIGWCAVEPRDAYPVLDRSKVLARVDEEPVWSIPCFFIAKSHRNRGVTVALLEAAAAFAGKKGGKLLEGYPIDSRGKPFSVAFAWTGFAPAFIDAGFKECARRSPSRPIMRLKVK